MSTDSAFDLRTALHVRATVQVGNKIEIASDQLREGDRVDVFLVVSETANPSAPSLVDFLDSLPSGPRSYPTWEEAEQGFQDDRNSWDR
ncbi:MAG TPA: hypothetical protein VNH11_29655 [Pirellulales bacterium]|nr:hypothetical protein [Pirellulales bacterium]HVC96634.1 hypothetical protein [Pirellulales bacterium]